MKNNPELFFTLLLFTFLLITALIFFVVMLRFIRKRDRKSSREDMSALTDAFRTLGGEISVLKEQLVLKDQLAAMGEISAGIAHQLRNPMAVIAGYSKLLLKSIDENDKRREMIIGILREIEEMNRVMEELLRLSRHEQINKSELNMEEIILGIISGIPGNEQKIYFQSHDPCIIKGDETLLRQAIKNIIQNALDVGDEVWIELRSGIFTEKEGALINIRDKGGGIPKEDINKIFMPFYTTKTQGTGIGLTMVHKIIDAHGGSIAVESIQGEGSLFKIFLPK